MSSMALGIGLTHIRQYDFVQPGYFYSGLLSFTSGIERVLKIILIYDYRLDNGDAFPNNPYLKSFSHKLNDLINKAQEINLRQGLGVDDSCFQADDLYQKIILLLTDFAVQARYHNLDYLTGRVQPNLEPLARWDSEICSEIISRHFRQNKKQTEINKALSKELEDDFKVLFSREDGTEISSLSTFLAHGETVLTKQKYSMYYLYTIANVLCSICSELEYKGNYLPYLREFYPLFMNDNRRYVLNRKTWNPMRP